MLAPAALSLAVLVGAPQSLPTYAWGEQEWTYGRGPLSRHYFQYGKNYPSSHELFYGDDVGSFHYLIYGNRVGSAHYWRYGRAAGSAYFWRYGRTAGSEYYWRYGRGCLSETGWRYGARCTGAEALVLKTACIAAVIDISPCQGVRTRLDEWLAGVGGVSGPPPSETVDQMRRPFD